MKFPDDIQNIKIAYEIVDYKKFDYELFQNKSIRNDTIFKNNSICILSGIRDNDTIFIVDENNNKDFQDDTIRLYKSVKQEPKSVWWSNSKLIKCKYFFHDGRGLIEDSSWVCIAKIYDEGLLFFVSHHLESTFSIDDQVYEIGIVDKYSSFCFYYPTLTLLSQNGKRKDTLIKSELINLGEFVKLKDTYYRFDTISSDGKYLTFIKENDFNSQVGTQVGMLAPEYTCISISGDTLSSKIYEGEYLLLVNLTACWSTVSSYNHYKDLTEKYKDIINLIGIDNSPNILKKKMEELNLLGKFIIAEDNKELQESYRPDYSSRTCFLISPDGRIMDKFEIANWESNLACFFKNK